MYLEDFDINLNVYPYEIDHLYNRDMIHVEIWKNTFLHITKRYGLNRSFHKIKWMDTIPADLTPYKENRLEILYKEWISKVYIFNNESLCLRIPSDNHLTRFLKIKYKPDEDIHSLIVQNLEFNSKFYNLVPIQSLERFNQLSIPEKQNLWQLISTDNQNRELAYSILGLIKTE